MTVYVNGEELPQAKIDAWELQRARVVARFLKSKFGISLPPGVIDGGDVAAIRGALVKAKLGIGADRVRSSMWIRLMLSRALVWVMSLLSLKRRKHATVEITGDGAGADELAAAVAELFLTNSPANRELALLACPDHYLLEAHDGGAQEIVETTGNAPLQSRVFVWYADPGAPDQQGDSGYPIRLSGVARLVGGTAVGGICHEYRDEGRGFRATITDEFPALFPGSMVRAQQLHLACEFEIWYRGLIERSTQGG